MVLTYSERQRMIRSSTIDSTYTPQFSRYNVHFINCCSWTFLPITYQGNGQINPACCVLGVGCWIFYVGCCTLDGVPWVLGVSCWLLDGGCCMLIVGHWVMGVGHWALGVGC
jgi:hypothetical protein